MNKVELIDQIAAGADISRLAAEQALNSLIQNIIYAVSNGEIVQIVGLGSFASIERTARIGRNPSTGALVQIQASRSVKFRVGSAFKIAMNAEPLDFS
jgi:DNA-binding protein HU-beta